MQLRFACGFHVEVNRGVLSKNPSPTVATHTLHLYNKLLSSLRAHTSRFYAPCAEFRYYYYCYYYHLIRPNTI